MKHIPNIFTLLNLFFGCLAIVFTLQNGIIITLDADGTQLLDMPEKIWMASLFIGIAAVVDFLDGFVARLFRATSEMGKQLDSLADVVSFGAKFGHYSYRWQLEGTYDQQITNGSIDIRRNDMPGLCNKFDYTRVGFIAAYRIPALKDLQIMVAGGKILSGRNVGESTTYSIGFSKILDFRKNKTNDAPSRLICRPGDMNHGGGMDMKEEHK